MRGGVRRKGENRGRGCLLLPAPISSCPVWKLSLVAMNDLSRFGGRWLVVRVVNMYPDNSTVRARLTDEVMGYQAKQR